MKRIIPIILFWALSCCCFSCKDKYTICNQNKISDYKAGFYNKNGAADVKTTPAELTLKYPAATNYIYNQQAGISDLVLSPDPTADSLRYYIKLGTALPADTLTMVYSTRTVNLSPECGDIFVHTISRVYCTIHTLDSVKIINTAVNNIVTENFRIYY